MSQQTTEKRLTQEQSALFDNLPWGEEITKWVDSKSKPGSKFPVRYKQCLFNDAPNEAVGIFMSLGLSERERIPNFSGIYQYGIGKDRFFQSKPYVKKTRTPEEQAQLQADRAGLEGTTTKTDYQERQNAIQQAHDENMVASEANTKAINRLAEAIENLARIEQLKLGEPRT